MSFVSIIATKKFITVMSDGQVTKSGKVLEENYQKSQGEDIVFNPQKSEYGGLTK